MKTEDPNHPDCLGFKRAHRQDKPFTQLAAKMDKTVLDAQRGPK
jgi:hypothetical protein